VLDHPRGRLDEALLIAAEIRRHRLNTFLLPGRSCVSACSIMFLAGKIRYSGPGSEFALHPGVAVNLSEGHLSPISIAAILDWVATPESVQARIASSAPDWLYWFGVEDKSQLGIVAIEANDTAPAVVPLAYRSDKPTSAAKPNTPSHSRPKRPPAAPRRLASVAPDTNPPQAAGTVAVTQVLPIPASVRIVDLSTGLSGLFYEDWYWAAGGIEASNPGPFADLEKLVPANPD
jgi:hypothetical protein